GLEERGRKRRTRAASTLDEFHHGGGAALAAPARPVDIGGAPPPPRPADEPAAAPARRPGKKPLTHGPRPFTGRRHRSRVPHLYSCKAPNYAVLSRGMIRSAFSRSIAIRSAPTNTAPIPFTCSSPVRYG